jgi:GNAT superfamily N-acetyltransferase
VENVERAFGRNLRDFVEASPGGVSVDCAGGVAAYLGAQSPLTTVKGSGPALGDADIDAVEEFFRARGSERAMFELAPWVSAEGLRRRGYEVAGEEDVVVRRQPFEAPEPGLDVVGVTAAEWPALQFRANDAADETPWREIVAMCAALPGAMRFGVRDGAAWIACAEVMTAGDVAIFGNDATCPSARGRGAQTATILARLRAVAPLGVQWIAAEVAPGSVSERNYLRCGFEIAYRRRWFSRAIRR